MARVGTDLHLTAGHRDVKDMLISKDLMWKDSDMSQIYM